MPSCFPGSPQGKASMTESILKEINLSTHDHWKQHVEQWRQTKLSQTAYCKQHALNYHQFLYWKHKFLNKVDGLIPVRLDSQQSASNMSTDCLLELASGHKLHIYNRETLLLLLEHLA